MQAGEKWLVGLGRAGRSARTIVVALLAVGLFLAVGHNHGTQLDIPPAADNTQLPYRAVAAPALPRLSPVLLSIPAIELSTPLDSIGMKPDGTAGDPAGFTRPSWFSRGPTPGELGSAVILGRTDSHLGPAVFFRLGELNAGDAVDVTLADGTVAHFLIDHTETVPKTGISNESVYGSHGFSALSLMTSGGAFEDRHRRHHTNVVIHATLVSGTRR